MKWWNHSEYNAIMALTQLVGLFPDASKLVQHFLGEERDLAGVDHINNTVNAVIQSHFLLKARSVHLERSGGTKLRNKKAEADSFVINNSIKHPTFLH